MRSRTFLTAVILVFAALTFAVEAVAAPPSNDDRADAIQVGQLPYSDPLTRTVGATVEADEPRTCVASAVRSIWYSYTAPVSMTLTAMASAPEYISTDPILDVFTSDMTYVGCEHGFAATHNVIRLRFDAEAGVTYLFRLAEPSSTGLLRPDRLGVGSFTLHTAYDSPVRVHANDDRTQASVIPGIPVHHRGTTTGSTHNVSDPRDCPETYRGVWFSYTPSANGWVEMTVLSNLNSISWNVGAAVYKASDLSRGTCDSYRRWDLKKMFLVGGETYLIHVGTRSTYIWSDAYDGYPFELYMAPSGAGPANDNKADATAITSLPYEDDARIGIASVEVGEESCGVAPERSAWYRFTPSRDMRVQRPYHLDTRAERDAQGSCTFSPQGYQLRAGVTYYFQIYYGRDYPTGYGGDDYYYPAPETARFTLREVI